MRSPFILFSALIILSCSCSDKKDQEANPENVNIPEALQEEKRSVFSSKGYHRNIIEKLYDELIEKTPALQELEKNIQDVALNKQDSARAFTEFDQKNDNYYNTADQYINNITDSVLKQNIRSLISNSLEKYNYRVQPNQALMEIINNKSTRLSDLYTVLKLTRTMAIMEKYQQTSQPSTHPLQAVNSEYDMVIEKTKKLTGNQ